MMVKSFIQNEGSVTIMFDGGMPKVIPAENPMFGQITAALANRSQWNKVGDMVDKAAAIRKGTNGTFYVQDGVVYTANEPMPETLSKRVIGFVEQGLPVDALVNFWNNLKRNPSDRSRGHLYAFLDQNNIPITSDGCFVAYKRVTADWKDMQTGKFDNSVGAKPSMPRSEVDPDPDKTCSSGLHIAAYEYAQTYGGGGGRLVEVKINPMNVVAVPNDYNGQKMRVCEYEVVRECEGPRTESLYPDDDLYKADEDAEEDVMYCPECGSADFLDGYCKNCGYDDSVDKEDDADNDESEDEPVKVEPDSRGRICVPAKFIRDLGLKENDEIYVLPLPGLQQISLSATKDTSRNDIRTYVVDEYDNVRLSEYTMGLAGLKNLSVNVEMNVDGDKIIIS